MKKFLHKKVKPKQAYGQVRILGGVWRGRKLQVLHADGLRPTPDRVKETLFNWLRPYVLHSHCLDAFSGAGTLAAEALSQGASQVTALEANPQAAKLVQANLAPLLATEPSKKFSVINTDCLLWLQQNRAENLQAASQFNVVFLDPPFAAPHLIQQTASALTQNNWLAPQALIYIEVAKNTPLNLPANWQQIKHKQAGAVEFSLYQVRDLF